jgi:DNA-binding NarL/FixJ family response regulator
VRDALGPRRFEQAFRLGNGMPRERILEYALELSQPSDSSGRTGWEAELTVRELEIARLVAEGLTNKQIAAQLVVSPRTVEGHVGNVLRKLGLERRSQLAALASATPVGSG